MDAQTQKPVDSGFPFPDPPLPHFPTSPARLNDEEFRARASLPGAAAAETSKIFYHQTDNHSLHSVATYRV